MARPRNSCVQVVNRFAREYQKTIASATGERTKHKGFRDHAATANTKDDTATNAAASLVVIVPRGSSRPAVRGLSASMRASARRLKPIAALRAATIATTIHPTVCQVSGTRRAASSAPAKANGSANTEWPKRTNDA